MKTLQRSVFLPYGSGLAHLVVVAWAVANAVPPPSDTCVSGECEDVTEDAPHSLCLLQMLKPVYALSRPGDGAFEATSVDTLSPALRGLQFQMARIAEATTGVESSLASGRTISPPRELQTPTLAEVSGLSLPPSWANDLAMQGRGPEPLAETLDRTSRLAAQVAQRAAAFSQDLHSLEEELKELPRFAPRHQQDATAFQGELQQGSSSEPDPRRYLNGRQPMPRDFEQSQSLLAEEASVGQDPATASPSPAPAPAPAPAPGPAVANSTTAPPTLEAGKKETGGFHNAVTFGDHVSMTTGGIIWAAMSILFCVSCAAFLHRYWMQVMCVMVLIFLVACGYMVLKI